MKLFSLRTLEKIFPIHKILLPDVKTRKAVRRRQKISSCRLHTQGECYDLKSIYDQINMAYFDGKLKLKITWFGSAKRIAYRHRKLGLYCFKNKMVKIHRLLDQVHFPPYFISYVVYHEMLHSVYPPIKAKRGRYKIHHDDFKQKEMQFGEYAVAKQWENANKHLFFQRNS